MKCIIITGVAGFIGHSLAKHLLNKGVAIVGIDNMIANTEEILNIKTLRLKELSCYSNFSFIQADIKEVSADTFCNYTNIIALVHLAANAGIKESKNNSRLYIENNIVGFNNIIELSYSMNIGHFIYASSSSVYGDSRNKSNVTNELLSPKSIYAITKYVDELIANLYSTNYNLKTTGLRFFSVYGPYGRPDMAPWIFAKSILNHKKINLSNNGYVFRDFTYIDDIVHAIAMIIEKPRNSAFAVYDIGASQPHSLLELIHNIELEYSLDANYISTPLLKEEAAYTIADMTPFNMTYGCLDITSFSNGISNFCKWYKEVIHK